jgi:hypothetical protein
VNLRGGFTRTSPHVIRNPQAEKRRNGLISLYTTRFDKRRLRCFKSRRKIRTWYAERERGERERGKERGERERARGEGESEGRRERRERERERESEGRGREERERGRGIQIKSKTISNELNNKKI